MVFLRQKIYTQCIILSLALCFLTLNSPVEAQDLCDHSDYACMLDANLKDASKIENRIWRDQQYRDIGGLFADFGFFDDAFKTVELIKSADKRAMTLRRIARAAVKRQGLDQNTRDQIIAKIIVRAQEIEDQSAHDIALTYIAATQGLIVPKGYEQAQDTIAKIKAPALRDKAFKEVISAVSAHKDINSADKQRIILSLLDKIITDNQRDNAIQNAAMLMMRDDQNVDEYAPLIPVLLSQIKNPLIKSKAMNDTLERMRDHQSNKTKSDTP